MDSIILLNGIELGIQDVYLTILVIFCALATLSWFVASKSWLEEETASAEHQKEHENSTSERV